MGKMLRVGIDPLLMFIVSLKRGNVSTMLAFSLRTFSYSVHFALSVMNEEQDSG